MSTTGKDIRLLGEPMNGREALELITELIHVQIRFHEARIRKFNQPAEVRARNTEIRRLQRELYEIRHYLGTGQSDIYTETRIRLNHTV